MHEQQSRQACDRCHDLKLRCHRSNADQCIRCLRAGSICVFSPSNRGRRPTHLNRRSGDQMSKCPSQRHSDTAAPPNLQRLRPRLGNVNAQNQLSHVEHVDDASIAGADTFRPMPNICLGVGPDDTSREDFTPSLNLSDASLGSGSFARYYHNGETLLSPTTDAHLYFLESFSGPSMPEAHHMEGETDFDIPQLQSQQSDLPEASDLYRKVRPQTQFLQRFMEDLLKLDVDLIRHTLEDPVLFDPANTAPRAYGTNASLSISECAIDTTLNLTQRLIKILRRAGSPTAQPSAAQNSHPHSHSQISTTFSFSSRLQQFTTKSTPQSTTGHSNLDSQQQETALDEISLLHALTTYMRLIDVYRITFSQTAEKFGTALAEGLAIPLPSLQIGTFAVDDPIGHITFVLQSALRLLDCLSEVVNRLTSPFFAGEHGGGIDFNGSQSSSGGHYGITTVMVVIRERESQLMQAVARLQSYCHEV